MFFYFAAFHSGGSKHVVSACIREFLYLQFGEHRLDTHKEFVHFNVGFTRLAVYFNDKAFTESTGRKVHGLDVV